MAGSGLASPLLIALSSTAYVPQIAPAARSSARPRITEICGSSDAMATCSVRVAVLCCCRSRATTRRLAESVGAGLEHCAVLSESASTTAAVRRRILRAVVLCSE
eukprot:2833243-Prymnesium_polylepis.1